MTEDLTQEAIDRAKAILRFGQLVLQHRIEGLTVKESSERLHGAGYRASETSIERMRRMLLLTDGRAWKSGVRPMGRARDITIEVAT